MFLVYINLPVGGIAMVTIVFFFKTPNAAKPLQVPFKEKILQMDLPGTFTIIAAMVCYLLAFQWGGTTKAWSDADVIGTLVGFVLLTILVVVIEYLSGERALIVRRLLKDRTVGALSAFIFFLAAIFFIQLYYLPLYFQTTRGASAQQSGIDIIPLVAAAGVFSFVAGGLISVTGHYVPFMVAGSCLAMIGSGLIYTFEPDTASRAWIGYQVLLGVGVGVVIQIPATAAQSVVASSDLAPVSAMILFFQTIGGAIWVSAAQAGFINRLVEALPRTAPGVDPGMVIATGATELRQVFDPSQVEGIIEAYMEGLRTPFIISIACAGVAVILAAAPRWERIKLQL